MKMQLNGREVKVKFHHSQEEKVLQVEQGDNVIETPVRGETHCILVMGDAEFWGVSHCSVVDQFNKATGRKVAFTRALQLATAVGAVDKVDRAQLWQQYLGF